MATLGKDGKDDSRRVHLERHGGDLKNYHNADNELLETFLKEHNFIDEVSNNYSFSGQTLGLR